MSCSVIETAHGGLIDRLLPICLRLLSLNMLLLLIKVNKFRTRCASRLGFCCSRETSLPTFSLFDAEYSISEVFHCQATFYT